MSVETLARVIKTAIQKATDSNGKARKGVYNDGMITCDGASYAAISAVPVNLYNGKTVWFQLTETGIALIIGD